MAQAELPVLEEVPEVKAEMRTELQGPQLWEMNGDHMVPGAGAVEAAEIQAAPLAHRPRERIMEVEAEAAAEPIQEATMAEPVGDLD